GRGTTDRRDDIALEPQVRDLPTASHPLVVLGEREQQARERSGVVRVPDGLEVDELVDVVEQPDQVAVGEGDDGASREYDHGHRNDVDRGKVHRYAENGRDDREGTRRPEDAREPLAEEN